MKHLLLILLFSQFTFATKASDFPKDWYQTEENMAEEKELKLSPHSMDKANHKMDKILDSHELLFRKMQSQRSRRKSRWQLKEILLQLGLTTKGSFGVLATSHTGLVQIQWKKRSELINKELLVSSESEDDQMEVFKIDDRLRKNVILTDLNPYMDYVLSTRRITNRARFKRNFKRAVFNAVEVAKGIQNVDGRSSNWHVSGMRLDLSVSIAGDVLFFMELGNEVRFRLEWEKSKVPTPPVTLTSKNSQKVKQFAEKFQSDLQVLNNSRLPGFELDSFKIGIGFSAGGDIGIIKLNGKAMYFLNFAKREGNKNFGPMEFEHSESDSYLVENVKATKSDTKNLFTTSEQTKEMSPILRSKLRKALKRSVKMASFFAKRVNKFERRRPNRKWYVNSIEARYKASLGGGLTLATLTSLAEGRILFKRKIK